MFTMKIELGNAAMNDSDSLAQAVHHVAVLVRGGYQSGTIHDVNGNAVGSWDLAPGEGWNEDDDED